MVCIYMHMIFVGIEHGVEYMVYGRYSWRSGVELARLILG